MLELAGNASKDLKVPLRSLSLCLPLVFQNLTDFEFYLGQFSVGCARYGAARCILSAFRSFLTWPAEILVPICLYNITLLELNVDMHHLGAACRLVVMQWLLS